MLTSDHASFSLKQYSGISQMRHTLRFLRFISIHFSSLFVCLVGLGQSPARLCCVTGWARCRKGCTSPPRHPRQRSAGRAANAGHRARAALLGLLSAPGGRCWGCSQRRRRQRSCPGATIPPPISALPEWPCPRATLARDIPAEEPRGREGTCVRVEKTFGVSKRFIGLMRNAKLAGRQRVRVKEAPASVKKRNDFQNSLLRQGAGPPSLDRAFAKKGWTR